MPKIKAPLKRFHQPSIDLTLASAVTRDTVDTAMRHYDEADRQEAAGNHARARYERTWADRINLEARR